MFSVPCSGFSLVTDWPRGLRRHLPCPHLDPSCVLVVVSMAFVSVYYIFISVRLLWERSSEDTAHAASALTDSGNVQSQRSGIWGWRRDSVRFKNVHVCVYVCVAHVAKAGEDQQNRCCPEPEHVSHQAFVKKPNKKTKKKETTYNLQNCKDWHQTCYIMCCS